MSEQWINPVDGAAAVLISAGEFLMGSRYEQPAHRVFITDFRLYRLQVTNRQYLLFCRLTGHQLPEDPVDGYLEQNPHHPVVNVSYDDAAAYASWAGGRLPSEAEWEKAARGGLTEKTYPWGDQEPEEGEWANFKYYRGLLAEQRIPFDPKRRGPLPCGSFPANGYGLFDMAGNAWDWVADFYDPDYYEISPYRNPRGPETGTTRVRRGGGWARSALSLRCACRSSMPAETLNYRMGFRVLMEVS